MSLLVTSCTMGKQPDRLLNKGPQYLRTRTNRGMFAHHRKSAVEVLAASKAQFYKVPSASAHDHHELTHPLDSPDGHRPKSQEQITRSKSEFDISSLKALVDEDEWTKPKSVLTSKVKSQITDNELKNIDEKNQNCPKDYTPRFGIEKKVIRKTSVEESAVFVTSPTSVKSNPSFPHKSMTILQASRSEECQHSQEDYKNSTSATPRSKDSPSVPGKPTPLPRKRLDKPVPPPRRKSLPIVPPRPSRVDSNASDDKRPVTLPSPFSSNADGGDGAHFTQQTESTVTADNLATPKRKRSLVETLAQHFTSLCTDFQVSTSPPTTSPVKNVDSSPPCTKEVKQNSHHKEVSNQGPVFQATPIYIPQEKDSNNSHFQAKPIFIYPQNIQCQSQRLKDKSRSDLCQTSSDTNNNVKGRKRFPQVPMFSKDSNSKRERKASDPESNPTSPFTPSDAYSFSPASRSSKGPVFEMSIESVQRVVYDSEVNAIPSAITTSVDSLDGGHGEPYEVTRVSSSLSGKMDAQDASSHLTHSPTHPSTSVPRSHSDISCRLEGQHSRDSSLVSNRSRLSRASAGADLEKFFNQMGLEKGILEPIARLKDLQSSEVLASVSSLDSHDASSIGSTFSGSDNDCSESQSMERSQQPTSVVERNARIIKWLCNVRKAKSQSSNVDGAVASSSSASPAAGNA